MKMHTIQTKVEEPEIDRQTAESEQVEVEPKTKSLPSQSFAGLLVEHGSAPYQFDEKESDSYYAKLSINGREHTLWGLGLQEALTDDDVTIGDYISLNVTGSEPKIIHKRIFDKDGNDTGETEPVKTKFNNWKASPLEPPSPAGSPLASDGPTMSKFNPVSASSFLKSKAAPKASLTQEELDRQEIEKQRVLQQGQHMQPGGGRASLFSGLMSSLFGGASRGYDKAMDNPVQKASMQRENQHELLIQSMTHSANKVAAMSAALETGDLAPVLKKMKDQGVSLQELTQNSDHKELRDEYVEAIAPHQRKLKQEMDQLAFYSDAAAKSAVEQGQNIEPQIADMFDNVGEATKNIATEDGEGKLKELSESMAEMMAKVQDAVRKLFSKFSPNQ